MNGPNLNISQDHHVGAFDNWKVWSTLVGTSNSLILETGFVNAVICSAVIKGQSAQTDTQKMVTWVSLSFWPTDSKVTITGIPHRRFYTCLPMRPLCVILYSDNVIIHVVSVTLSCHSPAFIPVSSSSLTPIKQVCAVSRNWFLFYYFVANLFFFLSPTLWHPLTSVVSIFCDSFLFPLLISRWL